MNKRVVRNVGTVALVLALMALGVQADVVGNEAPPVEELIEPGLFQPIPNLSEDGHVQDMESMPVGPAEAPQGAMSIGLIIGQTIIGITRLLSGDGNSSGKALAVVGGEAWVQEIGGPIDDFLAGSGYRSDFMIPVSEIQFEIVGPNPGPIEIEAFFLGSSLAPPQLLDLSGGNLQILGTNGIFFDRVEIRSVTDSTGYALDNIGVAGKMASRSVVCQEVVR